MPFGSLVLVAAALAGSDASMSPPALAPANAIVMTTAQGATPRRRRVGVGGSIVGGSGGAGGSFRYWFTNRIGMDAGGFWYRGRRFETTSGTFERTSAVLFSVSGLALLSEHNPRNEIDLRPIVGVGTNYIRSSQFVINGELATDNPRGWGWHALGGVEAAFIQGFAVTGALAYYRLPGDFGDAGLFDGFNLVISVHAYF